MPIYQLEDRGETPSVLMPFVSSLPSWLLPVVMLALLGLCLAVKTRLPVMYILVPLIAVAYVVKAALDSGRTRRAMDSDTLKTTPVSFHDMYLAEIDRHRRGAVLVSITLAGCAFATLLASGWPQHSLDPAIILGMLCLWVHLALWLTGAVLTAGAMAFIKDDLPGRTLSALGAIALHSAISLVAGGFPLVICLFLLFGLSGLPFLLCAPMFIFTSFLGPYFALRIGPGIVLKADRIREGREA